MHINSDYSTIFCAGGVRRRRVKWTAPRNDVDDAWRIFNRIYSLVSSAERSSTAFRMQMTEAEERRVSLSLSLTSLRQKSAGAYPMLLAFEYFIEEKI